MKGSYVSNEAGMYSAHGALRVVRPSEYEFPLPISVAVTLATGRIPYIYRTPFYIYTPFSTLRP